jgi:hypothetical protein
MKRIRRSVYSIPSSLFTNAGKKSTRQFVALEVGSTLSSLFIARNHSLCAVDNPSNGPPLFIMVQT